MTILIVDTDADIRQLLTVFLEYNGYRAVSVANGWEALTYLQRTDPLPQLILLDVMMPLMDGATFRQTQQHDPQLAPIPVVVMADAATIEEQAPTLTAEAFLPKPIDFDALLPLLEQYCSASRQHGV